MRCKKCDGPCLIYLEKYWLCEHCEELYEITEHCKTCKNENVACVCMLEDELSEISGQLNDDSVQLDKED